MIIPLSWDDLSYHLGNFVTVASEKAIPSTTTWIAYLAFFTIQIVLAATIPGLHMEGLPTSNGVKLKYLCNGYECYYLALSFLFLSHYFGYFQMSYISDHFGEFLVASMLIGDGKFGLFEFSVICRNALSDQ